MTYIIEPSCQVVGLAEIYERIFGNKTDGVFVEVGAYDGRTYSNTWGLAEAGWRGLYIEPIPELFDRCVGNHASHPNVKCVRELISDKEEYNTIYKQGDLYTISREYVDNKHMTQMFSTIESRRLDDVLWENAFDLPIDVLVIDVEGTEEKVLRGLDMRVSKPTLVIIEAHEHNVDKWMAFNLQFIEKFFISHGYTKIYSDHINNIYHKQV